MNKKLKILVSAYACNPLATLESYPGEAWDGWNQIKQLGRFHNLTVITRKYNKNALEEIVKKEKIKNIDFYYLELPKWLHVIKRDYLGFRIYYWLWQVNAFLLAIKLHKIFRFDIFHHVTFHNDWMPSYIGAYLPIPFIWGPLGGGQKFPRAFAGELKLKNRLKEITRSVFQEFWRHTPTRIIGMRKAKAVLVCNEETRKKVKRFSKNIYHFPVNGIAFEDLNPDRRLQTDDGIAVTSHKSRVSNQKSGDLFKVFTSGRFAYWKAFHLTVKAFDKFHAEFPDSEFEIVGNGAEESKIKEIIKSCNLKNSIKLTPWLPREELIKKMRAADVFLYASLREGGGAVVVEAMASGLPVICVDLAGPGFHIQNEWGIKIKAKNPEYVVTEMAKALEKLYLDDNLRTRMGINARKRAEEYYLWEKLGERLQNIYEEALSR